MEIINFNHLVEYLAKLQYAGFHKTEYGIAMYGYERLHSWPTSPVHVEMMDILPFGYNGSHMSVELDVNPGTYDIHFHCPYLHVDEVIRNKDATLTLIRMLS